jgi:DNA-binding winged helix-turn-helix (wHTH) protein/Tfp pilus assembly protein PilF
MPHSYFFGPFRLDTARMILYAGTEALHIPEQLFQLLLVLIEANGATIDRDTLSERVWGEAGVSDANLTQHIYLLRELLGERKTDHRYVLTVPRKGYRFAPAVSCTSDDPDELASEAARYGNGALTGDIALLRHYCRGNYLLDQRTAPVLGAAIEAFESALQIDVNWAPALIGLARAWALLAEYAHVPGEPALTKARESVDRALQLDPRSAMGLAVLSELQLFNDWDWSRSKESLEAALSINGELALARNNAAWYFVYQGELQRALGEARRALAAEPASLLLQLLMARVLLHAEDYAGALAGINAILASDPTYCLARRYRAEALILIGQPELAVADLLAPDVDASENAMHRLPLLARAWADSGDLEKATSVYAQLHALARLEYVSSYYLAFAAASIGRDDEALGLLQNASRERDPAFLYLRILPFFKMLESRSDFKELLRHTNAR